MIQLMEKLYLSKTFDKEIAQVSPLRGHPFLVEACFLQSWPMLAFFFLVSLDRIRF